METTIWKAVLLSGLFKSPEPVPDLCSLIFSEGLSWFTGQFFFSSRKHIMSHSEEYGLKFLPCVIKCHIVHHLQEIFFS